MNFISALALALVVSAEPQPLKITGRVQGASGKHAVMVALWAPDGFLKRPVQGRRFEPGMEPVFEFQVPPGRWALSAFEDVNGNGVLDQGRLGPKEPSGWWPPFTKWHRPTFDEVAFQVARDVSAAEIRLK